MATAKEALARLCDPRHEVSAHYLLCPDGQIMQMVAEEQRAWHAGAGAWGGCTDVNSRSIGVELANDGRSPFTAAQMAALEWLLDAFAERWPVPPERVIAHSDMAPRRKADPGARFDWRRLALGGRSVWPEATERPAPDMGRFCAMARRFGYPVGEAGDALLAAFRLRFRPWAWAGVALDEADMAMIGDLARRFPVDRGAESP